MAIQGRRLGHGFRAAPFTKQFLSPPNFPSSPSLSISWTHQDFASATLRSGGKHLSDNYCYPPLFLSPRGSHPPRDTPTNPFASVSLSHSGASGLSGNTSSLPPLYLLSTSSLHARALLCLSPLRFGVSHLPDNSSSFREHPFPSLALDLWRLEHSWQHLLSTCHHCPPSLLRLLCTASTLLAGPASSISVTPDLLRTRRTW